MRARDPGTEMIREAAQMLGEINLRVVFVGGAVVGLLIDDPGAQGIRATADVDTIVEVFEPAEFSVLEQALMDLKFEPVPELRCRYRKGHITLDFMPTISGVLGFSNGWYPRAYETALTVQLGSVPVRHINGPYFLATKLDALRERGKDDLLSSHDFEDIVAVVNGRSDLFDEIENSDHTVRNFLRDRFKEILTNNAVGMAIDGHLPEEPKERVAIIVQRFEAIAGERV